MSETTIARSSLPSAQVARGGAARGGAARGGAARGEAARASAQTNRIAMLTRPNAALQDMQEEVSFAFSERLEKRNAEQEKAQERSQKLLREFVEKIQQGKVIDDKQREPLEHKIERRMQSFSKHEDNESAWQNMRELSGDKAALLVALESLSKKSAARGDHALAERYEAAAERCALEFDKHIRVAINLGAESRAFAEQHDVEAEKVLDVYRSNVADYSGILPAALALTEALGVEKSEAGAAFIRQSAGKEIAMLEPSVSPEQLLHVLAELKGLQVLATVKEQVAQHRKAMVTAQGITQATTQATTQTKTQTKMPTNTPTGTAASGIAALSGESLVKGVFHSAVAPQRFTERLDAPASLAYRDQLSGLVQHFQGLHKIFKGLPDYAFVGRSEKRRALLPLETRLDTLVAQEQEATRVATREAVS